jgi:hypothetical protein
MKAFQTISYGVRPPRIAVLVDQSDPQWEQVCLTCIGHFTRIWGGQHCIIVPTNGETLRDVFWTILSAYDPDAIVSYQKDAYKLRPGDFNITPKLYAEIRLKIAPFQSADDVYRTWATNSSGGGWSTDMIELLPHLTHPSDVFAIQLSDKGGYAQEMISRFGDLATAATALRNATQRQLLERFLDRTGRQKGIHDEGVFFRREPATIP